jgi:hypothetical protein
MYIFFSMSMYAAHLASYTFMRQISRFSCRRKVMFSRKTSLARGKLPLQSTADLCTFEGLERCCGAGGSPSSYPCRGEERHHCRLNEGQAFGFAAEAWYT